MPIHIVRLGEPRRPGEGPRVGAVRFPPRGVPKAELASRDFYDVWLPNLAPSRELLRRFRDAGGDDAAWRGLVRGYRRSMTATEPRQLLDLLAALSHVATFSLGCYCADETRCHRTLLRELLAARGADLA